MTMASWQRVGSSLGALQAKDKEAVKSMIGAGTTTRAWPLLMVYKGIIVDHSTEDTDHLMPRRIS